MDTAEDGVTVAGAVDGVTKVMVADGAEAMAEAGAEDMAEAGAVDSVVDSLDKP